MEGRGSPKSTGNLADALPDTSGMNVLFINLEDCRADVFGCCGHPIVKTPNIDRLSASGVSFTNAFCSAPSCGPARSAFLTGLRPEVNGVLANTPFRLEKTLPLEALTIPELTRNAGFYNANVGKTFHQQFNGCTPFAKAFDRLECHAQPTEWEGMSLEEARRKARDMEHSEPITKEQMEKHCANMDRWGDSGKAREEEFDYQIHRIAVDILKDCASSNRRFFLSVGSLMPHAPLVCPKEYIDLYDPATIPLPVPVTGDRDVPDVARHFDRKVDMFFGGDATEQQTREAIAAYYACVTFVDEQVGRTLDALDELGLADNTIVFLLSDHGFHLGEHGLWSKYTLHDQAVRVPMIVRIPGSKANGQVCEEVVESIDLIPTLAELCGLSAPQELSGLSFAPQLADPPLPGKPAAYSLQYWNDNCWGRMARSKLYKYREWYHQGKRITEFYDMAKDPWEQRNVIANPARACEAARLAQLLKENSGPAVEPGMAGARSCRLATLV
jgi:arylsulfatase A-like enzyme